MARGREGEEEGCPLSETTCARLCAQLLCVALSNLWFQNSKHGVFVLGLAVAALVRVRDETDRWGEGGVKKRVSRRKSASLPLGVCRPAGGSPPRENLCNTISFIS